MIVVLSGLVSSIESELEFQSIPMEFKVDLNFTLHSGFKVLGLQFRA